MSVTEDRFWRYSFPEPNSGCWLWTGPLDAYGYGVLNHESKKIKAHRYSHTLLKCDISDGYQIDHLCRVRCCVNPEHLEAVTQQENLRRGYRIAKPKVVCKNGHVYLPGTFTIRKSRGRNYRNCSICHKEYVKKYKNRLRKEAEEG